MITDNETVKDNINPVNEIITVKNLLEFVFLSIENLEVRLKYVMKFELFLKSSHQSYRYLLQYISIKSAEKYVRAIQMLFENDDTMILIQNKMQELFPLDTQDVMTQDVVVVFVPVNNYT